MIKIGLTGGIGSGKSYAASLFERLGIPIYYADKEAKRLMNHSGPMKRSLKALLGKDSYHSNGRINRAYVASRIFASKKLLKQINAIVHPAVAKDFLEWSSIQTSLYCIEESAIIFENNLNENFDKVILVVADEELRIKRVIRRDGSNRKAVLSRMKQQLPDKKKIPLADFIIYNNEDSNIEKQVEEIHQQLIKVL